MFSIQPGPCFPPSESVRQRGQSGLENPSITSHQFDYEVKDHSCRTHPEVELYFPPHRVIQCFLRHPSNNPSLGEGIPFASPSRPCDHRRTRFDPLVGVCGSDRPLVMDRLNPSTHSGGIGSSLWHISLKVPQNTQSRNRLHFLRRPHRSRASSPSEYTRNPPECPMGVSLASGGTTTGVFVLFSG